MKIGGKTLTPPRPVEVVIYREDEQGNPANFTFVCGAVLDYSEFVRICPEPKPPLVTKVAGGEYHDDKDRRYLAKIDNWSTNRVNWMILKSLSHTPGLEWEMVNLKDPETWSKYETELKQNLTEGEFATLVNCCIEANRPSKNRRKEALENFTLTQEAQAKTTISQKDEPISTPSTEPANVSA